mmetsp:Transcript_3086/g.10281  ORF Transcript_3086/g.10281 Transcript_3086/m.10281 type:complete len:229 (-) Transcript_3086:230-916(-)
MPRQTERRAPSLRSKTLKSQLSKSSQVTPAPKSARSMSSRSRSRSWESPAPGAACCEARCAQSPSRPRVSASIGMRFAVISLRTASLRSTRSRTCVSLPKPLPSSLPRSPPSPSSSRSARPLIDATELKIREATFWTLLSKSSNGWSTMEDTEAMSTKPEPSMRTTMVVMSKQLHRASTRWGPPKSKLKEAPFASIRTLLRSLPGAGRESGSTTADPSAAVYCALKGA